MKKFIVALLVIMMMGMSTICAAASNGSMLDNEEKVASKIFTALEGKEDYEAAVAPNMTKGLAKNLTAAKFTEVKGQVAKDFGKLTNPKLFTLQKLDKADRVFYLATSAKAPAVEIGFVFVNADNKLLLDGFTIRPVEVKKAAPAQQPEK
jgi:hypothetical protein